MNWTNSVYDAGRDAGAEDCGASRTSRLHTLPDGPFKDGYRDGWDAVQDRAASYARRGRLR